VLRDIPAIGDEQLERSKLSVTSNAKAAQHESVHDQARRADLDDDSEAQPHGESRTASRFCHQEHDRIVVPRLGASRHVGGHGQGRASARRKHEARRENTDPRLSAVLACADDARPPAKIETETRTLHGHDRRFTPRVDDAHRRCRRPVEVHVCRRRGKRDRTLVSRGRARRGRHDQSCSKEERKWAHRPIAVNMSVAA
jgi:hypothetical protein